MNHKQTDEILKELKGIEARVSSLISMIEAENKTIVTTVAEIRKVAILEEIYRLGGTVTALQISDISKKYGKTPSSSSGYYSGNKPSLQVAADKSKRELTMYGYTIVENMRQKCGDNWIDNIPMDIINNPYSSPETEIYL